MQCTCDKQSEDRPMKFIAGFVVALIAVAAVGLVIMYTGAYNVAASVPDNSIVEWFLSNTMDHSVIRRAKSVKAPEQLTDKQARAGFSIYKDTCVFCHGAPGKEPDASSQGLNPQPPDLKDAVSDMTSAELFWIIKNGIKMSGMASYGKVHNDDEIWNVVAFLQRLPKMMPEEYGRWEKEAQ